MASVIETTLLKRRGKAVPVTEGKRFFDTGLVVASCVGVIDQGGKTTVFQTRRPWWKNEVPPVTSKDLNKGESMSVRIGPLGSHRLIIEG